VECLNDGPTTESFIAACVCRGEDIRAEKAAKLNKRSLATAEVDSLVRSWLIDIPQWHSISMKVALEIAKRGISSGVANFLVDEIMKDGCDCFVNVFNAIEAARMGADQSHVDRVFAFCLNLGWRSNALRAAKIKPSPSLIKELVNDCVREGDFEVANDAMALIGEKLTADQKERLVTNYIAHYEPNGRYEDAARAAELAGRKLTYDEVVAIMRKEKGETQILKYFKILQECHS
jgi:hypothetical protein